MTVSELPVYKQTAFSKNLKALQSDIQHSSGFNVLKHANSKGIPRHIELKVPCELKRNQTTQGPT